jgi:menaquinone-dependent protoporphyrinogen oxidase
MISTFLRKTDWCPTRVHPVAGALLYRQYGAIVRLVMRFIAMQAGATTDVSRDHEYTDWQAVDRFAVEFAGDVDGEISDGDREVSRQVTRIAGLKRPDERRD